MKIIRDDDGNATHWEAETDAERAAIGHVTKHVPWFAGVEPYGIDAFLAGVKWAEETRKP